MAKGTHFSSSISKELKDEERDESMARVMTQLYLLTKHVMGGGYKSVNDLALSSSKCYEDNKFEALYNEEVQTLSNQVGHSHPTFQRQNMNQGWNKDKDKEWWNKERDGNWRDRDREW